MILSRLARGERIEHYETVRVAKDGRRIDVSLTISPLRNSEGEIIGASKIARNITERKRAEEALKALAASDGRRPPGSYVNGRAGERWTRRCGRESWQML